MKSRRGTNRPMTPEFDQALREARADPDAPQPGCKGREVEFVDYSAPPSKGEAEALCGDCPLFALCRSSARQERPAWGVRGGIAWEGGRQVHWVKILKASRENR